MRAECGARRVRRQNAARRGAAARLPALPRTRFAAAVAARAARCGLARGTCRERHGLDRERHGLDRESDVDWVRIRTAVRWITYLRLETLVATAKPN